MTRRSYGGADDPTGHILFEFRGGGRVESQLRVLVVPTGPTQPEVQRTPYSTTRHPGNALGNEQLWRAPPAWPFGVPVHADLRSQRLTSDLDHHHCPTA